MIFRDKTGAPALERVPNLFRVNPSRLTKCPKRHHHVMPAGGKKNGNALNVHSNMN